MRVLVMMVGLPLLGACSYLPERGGAANTGSQIVCTSVTRLPGAVRCTPVIGDIDQEVTPALTAYSNAAPVSAPRNRGSVWQFTDENRSSGSTKTVTHTSRHPALSGSDIEHLRALQYQLNVVGERLAQLEPGQTLPLVAADGSALVALQAAAPEIRFPSIENFALTHEARQQLERYGRVLAQYPNQRVQIHTFQSERPADSFTNPAKRRAEVISAALTRVGVQSSQITSVVHPAKESIGDAGSVARLSIGGAFVKARLTDAEQTAIELARLLKTVGGVSDRPVSIQAFGPRRPATIASARLVEAFLSSSDVGLTNVKRLSPATSDLSYVVIELGA